MRISDWSSDVCSSDLAAGLPRLHPRQQDRLPTSDPVIEAIRKRTDLAAWFMGNARRACARSRLFIMSSPILFLSGGSALVLSAIPFTAAHAVISEERRVGKECVGTCSSGWSPLH